MRSSSASVSVSLPHCLHEMPQYIHTGIGWEMGADFSQIFSIGSSPGVPHYTVCPRLVRVRRTYSVCPPEGKLPCASGTYSTQEAGTRSPYVQYGRPGRACQHSSSQALFAARNEQLMIGAGQPVSLHGSGGPSVQDIDMWGRGVLVHQEPLAAQGELARGGLTRGGSASISSYRSISRL